VHSSLRSIGRVRLGAETVINAFQQVLGPTGTLVMPTFTYSIPQWGRSGFDHAMSPSRTGRITETLRLRSGAIRSDHPTHSFVAWGAGAEEATANHLDAVGKRSPLGWLMEHGGFVVQLGTDHRTNTSLHLCEELAALPYLGVAFTEGQTFETALRIAADGSEERVRVEPVPGCSAGFPRIEPVLAPAAIVREVNVGQAETRITSLSALAGVTVAALQTHPGLLLCTRPECLICQRRRAAVHAEPRRAMVDLIDLFIEGSRTPPITLPTRESVAQSAEQWVDQVLEGLGDSDGVTDIRRRLESMGIRVEERAEDAFQFSLFDAGEKRICIWRGAIERLAASMRAAEVACAHPLRQLTVRDLLDLALMHEAFHVLAPGAPPGVEGTLIIEIAARLFADRILQLPVSSLLIDVWLMHWAPDTAAVQTDSVWNPQL
jgi:aminoglycoside 3-N-acetyltransferase